MIVAEKESCDKEERGVGIHGTRYCLGRHLVLFVQQKIVIDVRLLPIFYVDTYFNVKGSKSVLLDMGFSGSRKNVPPVHASTLDSNLGHIYTRRRNATMGVEKTIIKAGTGRKPNHGEVVHAHYVGKLVSDGTEFDSSRSRGKPLTFIIGIGSVIKGWDEGIMDMQVGEIATLTITSDYGYGASGFPPVIPANADLQFEVELLAIGDKPASSSSCEIM